MSNQRPTEPDFDAVANEILHYLKRFPNAAETMDGIASWWIPRQRIHEKREIVERAVQKLVRQGRMQVTHIAGGVDVYRAIAKGEDYER